MGSPDESFADWELVRLPRLSVMPVSPGRWKKIESMAKGPGERRGLSPPK